jgi:hypothetical protein
MIIFYSGSGAKDLEILQEEPSQEMWVKLKRNIIRLLSLQGKSDAADLMGNIPFKLNKGTNFFDDDFFVLNVTLQLEEYVEMNGLKADSKSSVHFQNIAKAFNELDYYVRFIVAIPLKDNAPKLVEVSKPDISSEVVLRAITDAQHLIYSSGAVSAVDRVHTALHGYFKKICDLESIPYSKDPSLTELFKQIRLQHPIFVANFNSSDEIKRLFGALGTIIDSLNTIRNRASVAHPNENLLDESEALLVINCVRTVMHYLDCKLQ